eukprot:TRINITY_DN8137_c0_g1_i1.p1 TRINITY_DN8137_c0_g1~~TRINITY_DN8137_c0_g1_i1.p1  ORF type:complete len:138 (+),score=15.22 TRINITY_DN8137_c0_g1_i1:364-777(+)
MMFHGDREEHAIRFSYSTTMKSVFIDCAKRAKSGDQSNYVKFDWSNKFSYRATLTDLGHFLAVLHGSQSKIELIKPHDSKDQVQLLLIKRPERSYELTLSKMNSERHHIANVVIGEPKAMILVEFIKCAVRRGLGFT